mgnify:CR=1 FL=1|jgi:ABC-type multidrug transport system ATPase subunit
MLEVTDLVYSYGARNAVQQANFTIHKGECLGRLGPNGAGKTTIISCIVGLLGGMERHDDLLGYDRLSEHALEPIGLA